MKTDRLLLTVLCTAAATAFMASAYTFTQYKALPAEKLFVPAVPDSTQKENPFKTEDLLKARTTLPVPANDGWTTMVTDTAGRLSLVNAENAPMLHTFTTRLRSEGFSKGRLVLNSTARGAVRMNNETLITKAAADSLPADADAQVSLLPNRTYDITVDILGMPDDKSAPDFSLSYLPADGFKEKTVTADPDLSQRVSSEIVLQGERGSQVKMSDSGRYVIVTTREQVSDKESVRRAALYDAANGNILSDAIEFRSEWLPGKDAYYVMRKRGEVYDVYMTEVPSMRTSLLAKDIPDDYVSFAPGCRYLFYNKQVEADKESGVMRRYTTPDDRQPGDRDRSYIVRYDLQSHVSLPLTYGGPSTSIAAFTPDGSKMLFSATQETPDRFPFYKTTLMQMDLATLRTDTIFKDLESFNGANYSPDGKQLFILAGPDAFGGIGANHAPHEIGNDFDLQGYIYDIATRKARAMTRDFDPAVVGPVIWNPADNIIYFKGENGFGQELYALNPRTGSIRMLKTEVPYVMRFSMGDKDASRLAYLGGDFNRDGAVYVMDLKNGKSRLLADPFADHLKDVAFGDVSQWKFTAEDGTVVDGYMCLPPDFDASRKYPLIVYYYGGTSPSNRTFYHLYTPHLFASRDYVVYVVNPSGTTGYGQEYSARHVNAWGKRTADEIIAGTKEFCRQHKFVDDKKIGCIGASYGGFMTQYLQTLTDMFACAVSHAGISNVTSYWGEGYWGYSYNSVAAAKSYPWNNPDLFTKQGSLFNADKIHTPLLLLHGTVDTNVPIGESIQLFNALKILGREVEFITVSDENHVISGYDNRIIWQNTIMAWFEKWLKNDPSWWNDLYK